MAVREIAARFQLVCDGCGATEELPSPARPKYWSDIHILRDAYDFQGCAVADGSVKLMLCLECGNAAATALNETLDKRRAAQWDGSGEAGETGTGSTEGDSPVPTEGRDAPNSSPSTQGIEP